MYYQSRFSKTTKEAGNINNCWVVITSINPPNPRVYEFLKLGYKLVVVGDTTTNNSEWENISNNSLHYLSIDKQDNLFPKLSKLIGYKTYARKNFGYLYAILNGAEEIFDTDDDTFIRAEAISLFENIEKCTFYEVNGGESFNPYLFFAENSGIWPRGYPLRLVSSARWHLENEQTIVESNKNLNIDILQTLVNLEPDVDAIYRLTVSDAIQNFSISKSILNINPPILTPGNTQSTIWLNKKKFKYLYTPRWVSFRFCDILKMYIAQKNSHLSYAGFWTEQIRNPHDYLEDFESEISCYLHTEMVIKYLNNSNKTKLSEIYSDLTKLGVANESEVETSLMFENLVSKLMP